MKIKTPSYALLFGTLNFILWITPQASGQPAPLPVYHVVRSGVNADQAALLAGSLSIPQGMLTLSNGVASFLNPSNFMKVPTLPVTDPTVTSNLLAGTKNDFPKVPIQFEQIDFKALSQLVVPGSNEVMNATVKALDLANALPTFGTPAVGHTTFTAFYTNSSDTVVSNSHFLDTRVDYQFNISGYPLLGPGAQIHAAFGADGSLTRFHYAARQLSQGPTVQIITPADAGRRFADLFPGLNPEQVKPQLVYYAPPLTSGSVSNIIPWYLCQGKATVTNKTTGEVSTLDLLPAVIPATDDPAFVPSLTLQVSTLGGTQVVATARATGGTPPYTYLWGGSLPEVSSNTGPQIAYLPQVRIQPPVLNIALIAGGSAVLTWPDVTGSYIPESTTDLANTNWTALMEPVVTNDGLRSVTTTLDPAGARYFRLRFDDRPVSKTELVTVGVMDANGVQTLASQTVQVGITPTIAAIAGSSPMPRVVGLVDWGTESPYDPGLGVNDRVSWTTGMTFFANGGGTQRFLWTDTWAWKEDFIDAPIGINNSQVDNADITLYIGHGNPTVFTFTGGPGPDPTTLFYNEASHSWGNNDQEWLCLLSCEVLQFDWNGHNVWQRWGPNFDGLHILVGFSSLAQAGTGFPGAFAFKMLGGPFGLFPPSTSIVNAWFAAAHERGTGTPAAMGPIGPGGVWDYRDYYWGKGPVGPTIRKSQIHGWWYAN